MSGVTIQGCAESTKTQKTPPLRNTLCRPRVKGKFLFVDDEKYWIRGVTYGTFRSDSDGYQYHTADTVERDFSQIAANGINTVRLYTVPPKWLLEIAIRHGLRLIIGLPWEQHITFLHDRSTADSIVARIRADVRKCMKSPAVLCFAIGNEIPAPIVRWHGAKRIERFLERLYTAVKTEDPDALVTYVNYPSSEYLSLPFLDLVCFNVYLESQRNLEDYIARLQNLTDDRPLVMAEIGLDSQRNGTKQQATVLDWQIRTAFKVGCAGAIVFSWTDEWHRGGHEVEDWDFGLTTRQRHPKPALETVREAFAATPFPEDIAWPRVSVVVCSYNGARTIRETCEGLENLNYPNFEVIVVNDGSKDDTAEIAGRYKTQVISTVNSGLSAARNVGYKAATGEIVAYIDDDAMPDPDWLRYLANAFLVSGYAAIGGPNISPIDASFTAHCVDNAPGSPVHVLLSDTEAEHIPGCNMAFRKQVLEAIGGFDPSLRVAGDDVDICWRIQASRMKIGYCPAALVWHHRRDSVYAYLRQQHGYGKAEALLEAKWPEKYNCGGHLSWGGRIYGKGIASLIGLPQRVYFGTWGSAPFQSIYGPAPKLWSSLALTPEWNLVLLALGLISAMEPLWHPLGFAMPLFLATLLLLIVQAIHSALNGAYSAHKTTRMTWLRMVGLTSILHLLQPAARLVGRMRFGLYPALRRRGKSGLGPLWPSEYVVWSEQWQSTTDYLEKIQRILESYKVAVTCGGEFSPWDLEVRGGIFGSARLLLVVEEHGSGKQNVRARLWPRLTQCGCLPVYFFGILGVAALLDQAFIAGFILLVPAFIFLIATIRESSHAVATLRYAFRKACLPEFSSSGPIVSTKMFESGITRLAEILELQEK